jgi:hypothetical protein
MARKLYQTRFICYGRVRCWEVYDTEDCTPICRFTNQKAAYAYARALSA